MRVRTTCAFLAFAIAAMASVPASANGFLNIYSGFSSVEDEAVDITPHNDGPDASHTIDYETGLAGALRRGWWSEIFPNIGVAFDISAYMVRGDRTHINIMSLSPMMIIRAPIMRVDELPGGRYIPYVGIGPTFTWLNATIDFWPEAIGHLEDVEFDIGYQVAPGVAIALDKDTALFFEYRYAWHDVGFNERVCPVGGGPCTYPEIGKAVLQAHLVFFGISLRF